MLSLSMSNLIICCPNYHHVFLLQALGLELGWMIFLYSGEFPPTEVIYE